jgi:DNA-directed RNA polymerase specialized sigma24 family protein
MHFNTGRIHTALRHQDERVRTDEALLAAVRAGDDSAFVDLYVRYRGPSRAMARRASDATDDVDDVVGEAWSRLLGALRNGNGPSSNFPGYLATTVRRVAWTVNGRRAMCSPTDDETLLDSPFRLGLAGPMPGTDLAEALTRLPRTWREVIWRIEVEGEKVAAIAREQGKSANSVSAIASRARKRLREELSAVADSGARDQQLDRRGAA